MTFLVLKNPLVSLRYASNAVPLKPCSSLKNFILSLKCKDKVVFSEVMFFILIIISAKCADCTVEHVYLLTHILLYFLSWN